MLNSLSFRWGFLQHRSPHVRVQVFAAGSSGGRQAGGRGRSGGRGRGQTGNLSGGSRTAYEKSDSPADNRIVSYRPRRPTGRGGSPGQLQGGQGGAANGPLDGAAGRATVGLRGPPRLNKIGDLAVLASVIERLAGRWSADGNVNDLRGCFYALAKLCGQRRADLDLGRHTMQRLAEAYLPLVPRLRDARSCVAAMYACAKLGYWDGDLARAALERLRDVRLWVGATGQDHSILWWAVSTATPDIAAQAQHVLDISAARLKSIAADQLTSQGWSNVLLACARLQYGKDPPFLHHVTACLASSPDAKHQELANSWYSLGELAEDCSHEQQPGNLKLLASIIAERLTRVRTDTEHSRGSRQSFIPQELSNMLLGCAKLRYTEPELLRPLADAAGRAATKMEHQHLANSLYALGKLGCSGEVCAPAVQRLVTEIGSRLRDQPGGFISQHLSNMLLSLEGLQKPQGWQELAAALAEECRRRGFASFSPQHITNSVWALAKLGWDRDQGWYSVAVEAAMQPGAMAGAIPQAWSILLYGLALVLHRPHEDLLHVLSGEAQFQGPLVVVRSRASSQHCANMLWALAVLGLHSEQRLVDALTERLGELLQRDRKLLTEQQLANSLWALAVMGPEVLLRHSVLVEGLLREAVERWELAEGGQLDEKRLFTTEELAQLWQVQQELEHAAGSGGGGAGFSQLGQELYNSQRGLEEAARSAARRERLDADPMTSQMQNQVVRSLRRLAKEDARNALGPQSAASGDGLGGVVSIIPEYEVPELCCRVDVMVELAGGRRVVVEVDGPSHFLANEPYTRTKDGRTQLRDRQLERVFGAGNVVSVPYWEWDEVGSESVQGQEKYLRRLLASAEPLAISG